MGIYTFLGKKEAEVKDMLWASERLILGDKKKMVEFKGGLCYNGAVFQAPFPKEQGNCLRQWNT